MKISLSLYILLFSTLLMAQVSEDTSSYYDCKYLEEPTYIINTNNIYFENCNLHRSVNADPKTFIVIGKNLAYDNQYVYYNGKRLVGTPKEVEILLKNICSYDEIALLKKKSALFLGDKKTLESSTSVIKYANRITKKNDVLLFNGEALVSISFLSKAGMKDTEHIELVSILSGGRNRTRKLVNVFYILKNNRDYWKLKIINPGIYTLHPNYNTLEYIGTSYKY